MKILSYFIISAIGFMPVLMCCTTNGISPENYICEDGDEENHYPIQISTRELCGWSSSFDSLIITGTKIDYYCKSGGVKTSFNISCTELNSLLSNLDVAAFNKLDIHSCNICVDGCDYSLAIKTDQSFHKITIGGAGDLPLQQQRDFFNQLQTIRESITEQH